MTSSHDFPRSGTGGVRYAGRTRARCEIRAYGARRLPAGLPFVPEVDFCTTNPWLPRIATQI